MSHPELLPREAATCVNAVLSGHGRTAATRRWSRTPRHCETCREVASVSMLLREDSECSRIEMHVPAAGQVWWRAAVRARLESTHAAARPMTWMHGITARDRARRGAGGHHGAVAGAAGGADDRVVDRQGVSSRTPRSRRAIAGWAANEPAPRRDRRRPAWCSRRSRCISCCPTIEARTRSARAIRLRRFLRRVLLAGAVAKFCPRLSCTSQYCGHCGQNWISSSTSRCRLTASFTSISVGAK